MHLLGSHSHIAHTFDGHGSSEESCRDGPILLEFFLKFVLRHRIFPEMEKSIKKAIAVAEVARKELPHTFVLSKNVPDGFSEGCKLLFGSVAYEDRRG